jgi:TonB family protein
VPGLQAITEVQYRKILTKESGLMPDKRAGKNSASSWIIFALILIVTGAGIYIVKTVLSDNSPRKKSSVATVKLLKPPPPIKEKLPEPEPPKEIQKKEEIIDPVPRNDPNPNDAESDNTPAGDKLGLDAEGGAGSDSFGLVGKKGGRSLIAGSDSSGLGRLSLLSKYAGYTQIIQNEIRNWVIKRLEEESGIPKGKLQAVARVSVDSNGTIIECKIIGSSGNHNMDKTIRQALSQFKISTPPPNGMPRKIDIRLTYQS